MQLPEPINLEVRGEVYLPHFSFEKLNARRQAEGEPLFKNPRNAAAGTLRLLDTAEVRRRRLQILIYAVAQGSKELLTMPIFSGWESWVSQSIQRHNLTRLGFCQELSGTLGASVVTLTMMWMGLC